MIYGKETVRVAGAAGARSGWTEFGMYLEGVVR